MNTEIQTAEPETTATGMQTLPNKNGIMASSVIGQNGKALGDILMDNIQRVQDNPAYIPQAQAIADQVKEIINLAKVEVEMLKAVQSFKN